LFLRVARGRERRVVHGTDGVEDVADVARLGFIPPVLGEPIAEELCFLPVDEEAPYDGGEFAWFGRKAREE
jgi:hypothetical protein